MARPVSKAAAAAKKKAMEGRGKFEAGKGGSDYTRPYERMTLAAVMPYVKASADSVAVWGDTLPACVPPAFALRHAELKAELDVAMVQEKATDAAGIAASLVKALQVMDTTARTAGHSPPVVDGHLCAWGDKVYCLLASGNIGDVRRQWPTWTVYGVADVCALLSGRTDDIMATVANAFPNARIVSVGPMIEDAIDL